MKKTDRKLVKKTVIPVLLIDHPKDIFGLVHFPTEHKPKAVTPSTTIIHRAKHAILYRNQAVR